MSSRDLKPLSDDIELLLAAERRPLDPPDDARRRVRSRIEGTLGMVAVATAAGVATHTAAATAAATAPAISVAAATGGGAAPATLLSLTTMKVAVCVIGAAAAVGTGAYVVHRPAAPPSVSAANVVKVTPRGSRAHAAVVVAPPIAPAPLLPAPLLPAPLLPAPLPPAPLLPAPLLPAPPPTVAMAAPVGELSPPPIANAPIAAPPSVPAAKIVTRAVAPNEVEDDWSAEQRLLDRARAALDSGDSRRAIRVCVEHAHRFPSGNMVEEREMTWIEALVTVGERDAARTRAADFRRKFPHSMFLGKVDAALALIQ